MHAAWPDASRSTQINMCTHRYEWSNQVYVQHTPHVDLAQAELVDKTQAFAASCYQTGNSEMDKGDMCYTVISATSSVIRPIILCLICAVSEDWRWASFGSVWHLCLGWVGVCVYILTGYSTCHESYSNQASAWGLHLKSTLQLQAHTYTKTYTKMQHIFHYPSCRCRDHEGFHLFLP